MVPRAFALDPPSFELFVGSRRSRARSPCSCHRWRRGPVRKGSELIAVVAGRGTRNEHRSPVDVAGPERPEFEVMVVADARTVSVTFSPGRKTLSRTTFARVRSGTSGHCPLSRYAEDIVVMFEFGPDRRRRSIDGYPLVQSKTSSSSSCCAGLRRRTCRWSTLSWNQLPVRVESEAR